MCMCMVCEVTCLTHSVTITLISDTDGPPSPSAAGSPRHRFLSGQNVDAEWMVMTKPLFHYLYRTSMVIVM